MPNCEYVTQLYYIERSKKNEIIRKYPKELGVSDQDINQKKEDYDCNSLWEDTSCIEDLDLKIDPLVLLGLFDEYRLKCVGYDLGETTCEYI